MGKVKQFIFSLIALSIIILIIGKYYFPKAITQNINQGKIDLKKNVEYWQYKREFNGHNEQAMSLLNGESQTRAIPVLVYHGISEKPYKNDVLVSTFKEQMFELKRQGYQTITLQQFYDFIYSAKPLPEKSFLLTFDDGIKTSYYNGDPVLKAVDYNAVMFVISKYSLNHTSSPYYLSDQEVKDMIKSGRWEIQAHAREAHRPIQIGADGSQGSFIANKLWLSEEQRLESDEEFKERIKNELENVKSDIENSLGISVYAFAFPFGALGEDSANYPNALGVVLNVSKDIYPLRFHEYRVIRGMKENYPRKEAGIGIEGEMMTRIPVYPEISAKDLMDLIKNTEDKPLPFDDNFTYNQGWNAVWGDMIIQDGSLIIKPESVDVGKPESVANGSSIFLDGTLLFKDYVFKAKIKYNGGEVLSLRARYQDEADYVSCDYYPTHLKIRQFINGNQQDLLNEPERYNVSKDFTVFIKVNSTSVYCGYNDAALASTTISPLLNHGGIGIKNWDYDLQESQLEASEVSVEGTKEE